MNKRLLAACAATGLGAVTAFSAPQTLTTLMKHTGKDPSIATKVSFKYPGWVSFLDLTTADAYPTNLTVIGWIKTAGDPVWAQSGAAAWQTMMQAMFSTRCGFSTLEGGHQVFTNLLNVSDEVPLPLNANGQWAQANCLPATYDRNGMTAPSSGEDAWTHGCYVVNVTTDTDLTLNIGGVERNITASSEKQIFNINNLTADRSVSVLAADPNATVYLGIAENPLVEFIDGGHLSGQGATRLITDPLLGFTGIREDEYQMFALRLGVNTDLTCRVNMSGFAADVDYFQATKSNVVQKGVKEGPYFGRDSRIRIGVARGGLSDSVQSNLTIEVYGTKIYDKWVSDSELSLIRDLDVRAMMKKGIVFPRMSPDYWYLVYTVDRTNETTQTSTAFTDPVSGATGRIDAKNFVYTYTATYSLTNGLASTNMISIGDVTLSCAQGTVRGNKIDFGQAGTYYVTAVDRVGNCRTNRTVISGQSSSSDTYAYYLADTPGTWQEKANNTIIGAVTNATTTWSGTYWPWSSLKNYTMWNARRIPCQPQWSNGQNMGHYGGVHPISAHCVASARHHGRVYGCSQRYVSADGTVTGNVTTATAPWHFEGPWVGLREWALTNGFTQAEVDAAGIGDIVVARVAAGEVPAPCRPYLMSTNTAYAHFGSSAVLGWGGTQITLGWAVPVLFTNPARNGFGWWSAANGFPFSSETSGSTNLATVVRSDIPVAARAKSAKWEWPMPYGGDSGLPLYIEIDGSFILVSHYTTTGGGPSYVKGFEMLKAYIEWQGDEVLEYK